MGGAGADRPKPIGLPRLLRRICTGATAFDPDIDELCRLEFLVERPGGDGSTYVFKHALTHPRLQTYPAYIVGWSEACRGRYDVAVAACRRGLEQAPDRVSRAYASLFLACALVERGDHREALTLLEPVVAEFEEFAIPQWHAFAATLTGESLRGLGRIDEAEQAVRSGLQIATRAGYTFAAGFGNVVEGRLALEREKPDAARAAFLRALETFERSGATFEAARTRAELGRLERANG